MRVTRTSNGLKVHAVAGTYVVSLGFDLPQADCTGLLGFSIHRTDHTENSAGFVTGMKAFAETDPGFPSGSHYSTEEHPWQGFQWADYSAKPGHDYTYRVLARKGTPAALVTHAEVGVRIRTESPEDGDHDVYFNRGVAASQEYVRRFGNKRPKDVPNDQAFIWLSRGLVEALIAYLRAAVPGQDALRLAVYEINWGKNQDFLRVLDELKAAVDRGVDVRIVYDGRLGSQGDKYPGKDNRAAIQARGLAPVSIPRTQPSSALSHNKFIVKLTNNQPVAVWTGGANLSEGGLYGHSNVAHVVEDPAVAATFLAYWTALAADPTAAQLKQQVEQITPSVAGTPPVGTTAIFSPRKTLDVLDWYASLAMGAREGLMMTFAFGMNDTFKAVYQNSTAPLRLALLEAKTRPMAADNPAKAIEEQKIQDLRDMPENVFAVGSFIRTNQIDGWVQERLSYLNSNVRYVHNKFMLIDPLGNDPIVVAGSANFSAASTNKNDENMLIVRGNKRVADIYLGEFMRLWSHHAFRESLTFARAAGAGPSQPKPLKTDNWWSDSFGNTQRSTRRKFFARS